MSLASRISALASRVGLEVKTKIDATHPGVARAWVCFGYVGNQVVVRIVAQRGQRDPDGGGPLPRDLRYCHARHQLLLVGVRPQQHQQRHAAHRHRAIQYRPEDRPVRRHQLRHHVCIVRRLLRKSTSRKPLMAYTSTPRRTGSGAGQAKSA